MDNLDDIQVDIGDLIRPLEEEIGHKAVQIAEQKAINAKLKKMLYEAQQRIKELENPPIEETEFIDE